ncbi:Alpha/Beta hydrolase protein [Gilbertella persicaria]|uniref:Alpha/Beta hydrolase protein n=1 Tax=Gilbertella persicaria TaxID=101096 RepID=UPI00221F6C0E|nr:Alpha/Beta hydrolase protein [Gilbertella persicaria]KAI8076503.1 Alpha/Beta hydrolase protein [Gilbertella persicaria]
MSLKRFYSTVPLSFTKYNAPKDMGKHPLVICHGLFGSKQNWRSLAKHLCQSCQRDVYTLDARNHGQSPHVHEHNYHAMSQDVIQFVKQQGIHHPILMGHSMGGKVMMHVALDQPELPSKIVIVDIAPVHLPLTREYHDHIRIMRDIQSRRLTKQKEADKILQTVEPDLVVRQFLLTNLKKNKEDGVYQFRNPLSILENALSRLGEFRQTGTYEGPTLFITGDKSPFRKPFIRQPELAKRYFPNAEIVNVKGAGHWVQAEKPQEFLSIATEFINKE